jgi:adenine-specific DNA methylase
MTSYPKRLIEVDLPIKRISAHARREKSIRHGHISTLHIWWARRPLAACRAVICAALWPDPVDVTEADAEQAWKQGRDLQPNACPPAFREAAAKVLHHFARAVLADNDLATEHCSPENFKRWTALAPRGFEPDTAAGQLELRAALLDFIADFANWDNSTTPAYLETSRALTLVAHHSLTDPNFRLPPDATTPSSILHLLSSLPRPLVVDPFAGGGSIPLEALRVGADAFASDLNPVAVLLNKVVLEYIPRYAKTEIRIPKSEWTKHWADADHRAKHAEGVPENSRRSSEPPSDTPGPRGKENRRPEGAPADLGQIDEKTGDLVLHGLADAVRYWGAWIKKEAEKELAEFYPKDKDGATPIAYLWARTIRCEGPGCGAEVPLMRSLWLAKKPGRGAALRLVPHPRAKRVDFQIIVRTKRGWVIQDRADDAKGETLEPDFQGTVRRGSATCPCCGYTTPVAQVREQLKTRRGGANDARLLTVITSRPSGEGRFHRLARKRDSAAVELAATQLASHKHTHQGPLSLVPEEELDVRGIRRTCLMIYGFQTWDTCFSSRQQLAIITLFRLAADVQKCLPQNGGIAKAVRTCLAIAVSRVTDYCSSLCTWHLTREVIGHTFARQALPMVWDFAEVNPLSGTSGDFPGAVDWVVRVARTTSQLDAGGSVQQASATSHPLPSESADCFATDPPYYDAVPYAYLSDFFYVWLRRALGDLEPSLLSNRAVPKDEEIVVDRMHGLSNSTHDIAYYEGALAKAFSEGRRVAKPGALGVVVFASKTTASWEAILKAVVGAGWTIAASWPIDTEMEARVAAQGQARLASSVHLVCRPRENPDALAHTDQIGDWRDVLQELPCRIHEWMPRLAEGGVVGADAIFACLGPALEIFSRYSRVERATGEPVKLKDYLEQVWAVVANEALQLVFEGADTSGFEEDARLTAMWLWTLKTGGANGPSDGEAEDEEADEEAEGAGKRAKAGGFPLEYDAARKIAQGLGAHLEAPGSLVEVAGDTARLLPVAERAAFLFGKQLPSSQPTRKAQANRAQLEMAGVIAEARKGAPGTAPPPDEQEPIEGKVQRIGATVLDRVHQAMILFAASRGEALKRFVVEDGAGKDPRFWRLAQALSALYPASTEEKRWVDGVLARKKGLGF